MGRMPRLTVPGYPHHITQRGGRRQPVFFSDSDYKMYVDILAAEKDSADVEIWAYCLMPNHVHVIATPENKDGLSRCFRVAHREYARRINKREGWQGHLWQERFYSAVLDEQYLMAAVRYTELNPVRAGLCQHPGEWRWSSVHAHITGTSDRLVNVEPMANRVTDWQKYLNVPESSSVIEEIRLHSRTGRPVGSDYFVEKLEGQLGVTLRKRKPGPKPKN